MDAEQITKIAELVQKLNESNFEVYSEVVHILFQQMMILQMSNYVVLLKNGVINQATYDELNAGLQEYIKNIGKAKETINKYK